MTWTQKHDIQTEKNESWVLWGKQGSLDTLDRNLDIQHQLRESARRFRKLAALRRQSHLAIGTEI